MKLATKVATLALLTALLAQPLCLLLVCAESAAAAHDCCPKSRSDQPVVAASPANAAGMPCCEISSTQPAPQPRTQGPAPRAIALPAAGPGALSAPAVAPARAIEFAPAAPRHTSLHTLYCVFLI